MRQKQDYSDTCMTQQHCVLSRDYVTQIAVTLNLSSARACDENLLIISIYDEVE